MTERHEWTVTGMDCAACTTKVTRAIEHLPGVSAVRVTLMAERLSLQLEPGTTPAADIESAVRKLGYGIATRDASALVHAPKTACCGGQDETHQHGHEHGHGHGHDHASADRTAPWDQSSPRWFQTAKGRLVLSTGALLALAWAIELLTTASIGYWAFLVACLIGVAPVAARAYQALRMGQPFTIESLMTIAAIGALFIGAAEEAALVVFLFAVGELLEGVAANRARDGIRALADLVPKTALREGADATTTEIAASALVPGDIVLARPGDRIPADGEILTGTGGIDESPVTGESIPVTRGPGDLVFAGAINTEAALRIRVTRGAQDNTIARIIRLVEEAEESRAPTERFIDRFSRWYMPAIVLLAALVVVIPPLVAGQPWDVWIYRGLALLLIGCPCALVISVPAAIASALSTGARRGLLMKGGAVIEAAATVNHVAFDKTGTLTHGRPMVTALQGPAGSAWFPEDQARLLATAAAVETGSSHPLALAILNRAAEEGIAALPSDAARAIAGKGVTARVAGYETHVASPPQAVAAGVMSDADLTQARALESEGNTVVAVYRPGQLLGLIAIRDEPRADAPDAMRQLRGMGITPVILTGDNPRTAAAIAGALGMDYRAEMLPEHKLAAIREMLDGGVMMVGDGINDAPALKQASVGAAMGSGTDVALETADAAILRDRVADVPALIRLARATMANIRQNITIALGLKAVFLVTSVLGITGLWIAIMADTGATVLVTLNALRLLRYDPTRHQGDQGDSRPGALIADTARA